MRLEQHARAQREARRLGDGPFHGVDVGEDLFDVGVRLVSGGAELEDLGERGLGALDHRRGHGLAQQVGPDQQVGVGQELSDAREPAERGLGVSEQRDEAGGQLERAWERRREVRDVGVGPDGAPRLAERGAWEVGGVHRGNLRDPNE